MNTSLENLINTVSAQLQLNESLMNDWLHQHMNVPTATLINLFHLAQKYELDPLSDEVAIASYDDASHQAYISIDGWSKLINQHPQYGGMSLRDSQELIDGVPRWMECAIYRNDRILPTVIKEYLEEVKTDHPSWQKMPRRMLRHRVIQQCARLAFGISGSETIETNSSMKPTNELVKTITTPTPKDIKKSRTEVLKEKLSQQIN